MLSKENQRRLNNLIKYVESLPDYKNDKNELRKIILHEFVLLVYFSVDDEKNPEVHLIAEKIFMSKLL